MNASSPDPRSSSTTAEPRSALLLMCVHCGRGTEAPLPLDRDGFDLHLARICWFVSVLSPPGAEAPALLGALCSTCAPTVFPPEVMRIAEERRQQIVAPGVP